MVGRAAAKHLNHLRKHSFKHWVPRVCWALGKPRTNAAPFFRVDHMKQNDLVDSHEVAINSREFERQMRELGRVTVLGWVATFLLAATLFVLAATLN